MGSTHCIFGKKLIRVRFTQDDRYLLKKDIKWKDIEKLVHIGVHISLGTFILFISLAVASNSPLLFLVHCQIYFSSYNKVAEIIFEARNDKKLKVS